MKKISYILFVSLLSLNTIAQSKDSVDSNRKASNDQPEDIIVVVDDGNKEIEPEVWTVVDEMPKFPGGEKEMYLYIEKNLVIPASALKNNTLGKCFFQFTVMKDGSLADIKILKGVPGCPECDEEAKKLLTKMPLWIPGRRDGKSGKIVNVNFYLPINFERK